MNLEMGFGTDSGLVAGGRGGIEKFPFLSYIYSMEKLEKVEIESGEPG